MPGGARRGFGQDGEHLFEGASVWPSGISFRLGLGAPRGVHTRGITPLGTPSGRGTWGRGVACEVVAPVGGAGNTACDRAIVLFSDAPGRALPRGIARVGASGRRTRPHWTARRGRAADRTGMGRDDIDTRGAQGVDRGEIGLVLC